MNISPIHPDWFEPDWPAPASVRALCTARQGGCSAAPFDSFNLGDHVGDDPIAVATNRQQLQARLAAVTPGARPVFLQQVHGTQVVLIDRNKETAGSETQCADASIASAAGRACTIMVADCLPVLLTNGQGSAVAAAHAGWRGLAGSCASGHAATETAHNAFAGHNGVLETALRSFWALAHKQRAQAAIKNEVKEFQGLQQSLAADTLAWLGPCIGCQAFEVGEEVRAAFCDHDAAAERHFVPVGPAGPGKYLADLAGLARQRLHAAGVTQIYGNDSTLPWCTVTNPSRFFSHRRDSVSLGATGRFAVCIWRV